MKKKDETTLQHRAYQLDQMDALEELPPIDPQEHARLWAEECGRRYDDLVSGKAKSYSWEEVSTMIDRMLQD